MIKYKKYSSVRDGVVLSLCGAEDEISFYVKETKWRSEKCTLKDCPVESLNEGPCPRTQPAALVSPSSETVTSAEGFVYVTLTSLILLFPT